LSLTIWLVAIEQHELPPCVLLGRNGQDSSVPVVLGAPERLLEEASWAEVFENLGAEVPWLLGLVVARLVEEAWLMMMQRCTLRNEEVCWPPLRLPWHVALPSLWHGVQS
jgi:hypothetical protein